MRVDRQAGRYFCQLRGVTAYRAIYDVCAYANSFTPRSRSRGTEGFATTRRRRNASQYRGPKGPFLCPFSRVAVSRAVLYQVTRILRRSDRSKHRLWPSSTRRVKRASATIVVGLGRIVRTKANGGTHTPLGCVLARRYDGSAVGQLACVLVGTTDSPHASRKEPSSVMSHPPGGHDSCLETDPYQIQVLYGVCTGAHT